MSLILNFSLFSIFYLWILNSPEKKSYFLGHQWLKCFYLLVFKYFETKLGSNFYFPKRLCAWSTFFSALPCSTLKARTMKFGECDVLNITVFPKLGKFYTIWQEKTRSTTQRWNLNTLVCQIFGSFLQLKLYRTRRARIDAPVWSVHIEQTTFVEILYCWII